MPWCLPLRGPVIPWQPARVICSNAASNSQMPQSKATDKMQQQAEAQGSFLSPGGLSLFWQVLAAQKKNLAEAYCDRFLVVWSRTSAASSTFICTFYYDLMHSLIASTSVTPSEESLLLSTQLFSVNFYWAVLQCCFMFYVLKRINEFCFRKPKWKKMSESGQLMTFSKPASELFCFYY